MDGAYLPPTSVAGRPGVRLAAYAADTSTGLADLDRVVDRVLAPLEPAAVVDRDARPVLEVRVEPGLAGPPAGAAVERDPLVGRDPGLGPVGRDLGVRPHRVVDVAVVLHVVGVGAAVAPDVALDPARRADVVVAADVADVLAPRADADEGRAVGVGDDLLGLVDVDDDLRAAAGSAPRSSATGVGSRGSVSSGLPGPDPPVVAAIEQPHVVDAGVAQDHQRPGRRDLAGPTARPLLVGLALGVAAVDDDGRVVGDARGRAARSRAPPGNGGSSRPDPRASSCRGSGHPGCGPRRTPRAPRSSRGRAGTCPRARPPGARPRAPRRSQSMCTSLSYFGRRSSGRSGSAAQAEKPSA